MSYNVVIDVIEKAKVAVSDDVKETVEEVHEALKGLPGDRAANLDFPGVKEVKDFMAEAKQHAEDTGRRFIRVGDVKGQPLRVSFRIVTRRATDPAPAAEETPTANAASAPAEPVSV
jgi:hypothetical protein